MRRAPIALLLLALACSCRRDPAPAPPELSAPPVQSAPALERPLAMPATSEATPKAATSPPPAPSCAPPPLVDAQRLTATWPQRIGERVRLSARVERSIDLMTALVTSKGARFVVVLGPDQIWDGERVLVFRVMGSTQVALGGRVTLPQLLLEPDETCDAG